MKTYHFSSVMVLLFVAFASVSCNEASAVVGRGAIRTETRVVSAFSSIDLRSHARVVIKKGDTFKVEVSDYENLLPHIEIKSDGKTLTVDSKGSVNIINSKTSIDITMPDPLYRIAIQGSGDFYVDSPYKDLESISIAGSGNVTSDVPMELNELKVKIAGSGDVALKGSATKVNATIAGSGNIYLSRLAVGEAECLILGSGDIEINVLNNLNAKINGSGDIRYSGNPASEIRVNGSGKIEKL